MHGIMIVRNDFLRNSCRCDRITIQIGFSIAISSYIRWGEIIESTPWVEIIPYIREIKKKAKREAEGERGRH